jgi:hypothetical protein
MARPQGRAAAWAKASSTGLGDEGRACVFSFSRLKAFRIKYRQLGQSTFHVMDCPIHRHAIKLADGQPNEMLLCVLCCRNGSAAAFSLNAKNLPGEDANSEGT